MFWAVAHTFPALERIALKEIIAAGFEAYAPRFREIVVRRGRRIARAVWLFPRYVLVKIENVWHGLCRLRGVQSVLQVGDCVARVPEQVVDELKSRELKGFVQLEKRNKRTAGDVVIVKRGVFKNREGIYQGMAARDRVHMLFGTVRAVLASTDLDDT